MEDVSAVKAYGELVDAVRDRRSILFAGAGVSMAVGLPSWSHSHVPPSPSGKRVILTLQNGKWRL